ncbi:unnamed protein product, partial [Gulo gulo]
KKEEELLKQPEDPKLELSQLRTTKVAGGVASDLSKIELVCQSVTCVLTIINQTQKVHCRKLFKGKKFKPRRSVVQEDTCHVLLAEQAQGKLEDQETTAEGGAILAIEVQGQGLSTGIKKTQTN